MIEGFIMKVQAPSDGIPERPGVVTGGPVKLNDGFNILGQVKKPEPSLADSFGAMQLLIFWMICRSFSDSCGVFGLNFQANWRVLYCGPFNMIVINSFMTWPAAART